MKLFCKMLFSFCIFWGFGYTSSADTFSLRNHDNVTFFYQDISKGIIELGVKYNVPPASLLAIAGLESGYGEGYVSQITGNILSLGARRGEVELPALKLARNMKTGKLVFDSAEISSLPSDSWKWEMRPACLKKDYRPKSIAGTKSSLSYFKNNNPAFIKARLLCVEDFMLKWLSHSSQNNVYKGARAFLDDVVERRGSSAIFDGDVCVDFINKIGGKPNSFNYRQSWPKKVISILNKAGLVELCSEMSGTGKSFEVSWGHEVEDGAVKKRSKYVKSPAAMPDRYSKPEYIEDDRIYIRRIAERVAMQNSVSYPLVDSLIKASSNYDEKKIRGNRYGLMQVTDEMVSEWSAVNRLKISSLKQVLEPEINIQIGTWYISNADRHWRRYKSNAGVLALCDYFVGRKSVKEYTAFDKSTKELLILNEELLLKVCSITANLSRVSN